MTVVSFNLSFLIFVLSAFTTYLDSILGCLSSLSNSAVLSFATRCESEVSDPLLSQLLFFAKEV